MRTILALMIGISALACTSPARAQSTLAVGVTAPDFTLVDQDNKPHTLSSLKGQTVVLAFYPADFTAGCTREAHSLSRAAAAFARRGVKVYGISTQGVESKAAFCEKEGIQYPLLADTDGSVAKLFGVYSPDKKVAQRATFIIGPDGKIASVDNNVQVDAHGANLLAAIDKLAEKQPGFVKNVKPSVERPFPLAVQVGEPAPLFTLKTTDGRSVGLAHENAQFGARFQETVDKAGATQFVGGKPVVVMFVSTRCPVSNAYNKRMAGIAAEYGGKGVTFLAVNANKPEPADEIARHASKNGFPFAVLKDEGNSVADAYGALVTPEVFVIDTQGIVRYHGRIDDSQDASGVKKSDLKAALDAVLAGKLVERPEERAFGCSIKRVKPIEIG